MKYTVTAVRNYNKTNNLMAISLDGVPGSFIAQDEDKG